MRRHTTETHPDSLLRFSCTLCDQSFSREENLRRHTTETHPDSHLRFSCTLCDQSFSRITNLIRHVSTNHVQCTTCGEHFHVKNFPNHSLTHNISASLAPLPNTLGKPTDLQKSQLLFWEISGLGRVSVVDSVVVPDPNSNDANPISIFDMVDVPPINPLCAPIIHPVVRTNEFVDEKTIVAEILTHKLTPLILDRVVTEFKDFFNPYLELKTCASCGERRYDVTYSMNDVTKIKLLRLSSDEIAAYIALGIYSPIRSVWIDKRSEKFVYFHAHPEFVDINGIALLCINCSSCLTRENNPVIPKYCIANGHDFGDISRLPLSMNILPLTLAERHLIALARPYGSIYKLTNTQRKLNGHIISFMHNGALQGSHTLSTLFANVMPQPKHLLDAVKVAFVGPDDQFEFGRQNAAISCEPLNVRADVVVAWLKMCNIVNPLYKKVEVDCSSATLDTLNNLRSQLFASGNIDRITDDVSLKIDANVGADVAAVHSDSYSLTENTHERRGDGVQTYSNGHSLLTNNSDYAPSANNLNNALILEIAEACPDLRDSTMLPGADPVIIRAQRTTTVPINEFVENDSLFYSAHPDLFLFGTGIPKKSSLPPCFLKYLLNQYSCKFAQDVHFNWLCLNQKQRHAAARVVAAKTMSNASSIAEWRNAMMSEDFQSKLINAVNCPKEYPKDVKFVLSHAQKFLRYTSAKIPYSAGERAGAISNLYALTQRFGQPSVFFTFAPGTTDTQHPLSLFLLLTCYIHCLFNPPPSFSPSLLYH